VKYILALILCVFTFSVHAQQEEFHLLLSVQSISGSEASGISFPDVCLNKNYSEAGFSLNLIGETNASQNSFESTSPKNSHAVASKRAIRQYANTVAINILSGYTYHIADYYGAFGSSRIVTCLDGPFKGCQGIADNGVLQIESNEVKWHKGYFEHRYPGGKVVSYPTSQYFETK
jgi:hypothetical protein